MNELLFALLVEIVFFFFSLHKLKLLNLQAMCKIIVTATSAYQKIVFFSSSFKILSNEWKCIEGEIYAEFWANASL